ncbi:MAG TPA: hypothetical protein GXZ22_02380 [Clostridiaceae bacterium]|nr:hypothetical protein [Clostridiaceae bacterium]
MNMASIIEQMVVLLFASMLGFVGAKLNIMNDDSNKHLSRIVLNLTLPCSILASVFRNERLLSNSQTVLLTVIAFLTVGILIVVAIFLVKLLRIPSEQIGVTKFMLIFTNSIFFGFPVIRAIFGPNALFYAAIINMAFYIFCYTYGIVLVSGTKEKSHFSWKALLTPMVLASLLSYVIYFIDFQAPEFIVNALMFMDGVTSPLSMMTIGCALAAISFKKTIRAWRVYIVLIIRMLIFPFIYYFLIGLFIDNRLILSVATIITAMPAPASTTMLCANYGGDQTAASAGVLFSTLISLATIPLLSFFLLSFI